MIMSMKSGIIFVIDTVGWVVHLKIFFINNFLNTSIIIIIFIIVVFTTDTNFGIALSYI